jgi:hypothetical protein
MQRGKQRAGSNLPANHGAKDGHRGSACIGLVCSDGTVELPPIRMQAHDRDLFDTAGTWGIPDSTNDADARRVACFVRANAFLSRELDEGQADVRTGVAEPVKGRYRFQWLGARLTDNTAPDAVASRRRYAPQRGVGAGLCL